VIAADIRSRSDGASTPRLAAVSCELHEALEQACTQPRYARMPEDFDYHGQQWRRSRGSPATISEHVRSMADAAGASYFIAQFSFGDLVTSGVLHSGHLPPRAAGRAAGTRTSAV